MISLISLFASCKKSEIIKYDASSPSYIGFSSDSTYYSFLTKDPFNEKTDIIDTATINIKVVGDTKDHDRTFVLTVQDSSTALAGTEYELLSNTLVVPANESSANIKIKVTKTDDIKNGSIKYIYLTLGDTDELKAQDITGSCQKSTVVQIFNSFIKPKWWSYFFSQYSDTKYGFYISVMGDSADPCYIYYGISWAELYAQGSSTSSTIAAARNKSAVKLEKATKEYEAATNTTTGFYWY